jgi:hypothetical protein
LPASQAVSSPREALTASRATKSTSREERGRFIGVYLGQLSFLKKKDICWIREKSFFNKVTFSDVA